MPPSLTNPQTYLSLCTTFTAFLTIAIHTILYERSIYPHTTFLTARAYNFPVRQSRHPLVCAWITDAVAAVHAQLLKCAVARVCIVVFEAEGSGGGRPLERFVFDVGGWPVVPQGELDTLIVREGEGEVGKADSDKGVVVDMEEQFRAVMTRLAVCSTRLAPLTVPCTFTVSIELKNEADPPIGHPQPWIPSEPSLQRTLLAQGNAANGRVKKGLDIGGVKTIPMRTVEAGEMVFEMWVEEAKAKFEQEGNSSIQGSGSSVMAASSADIG